MLGAGRPHLPPGGEVDRGVEHEVEAGHGRQDLAERRVHRDDRVVHAALGQGQGIDGVAWRRLGRRRRRRWALVGAVPEVGLDGEIRSDMELVGFDGAALVEQRVEQLLAQTARRKRGETVGVQKACRGRCSGRCEVERARAVGGRGARVHQDELEPYRRPEQEGDDEEEQPEPFLPLVGAISHGCGRARRARDEAAHGDVWRSAGVPLREVAHLKPAW